MKNDKQTIQTKWAIVLAVLTIVLSIFASYIVASSVASSSSNKDSDMPAMNHDQTSNKLMIHISSGADEPHSVMMGLQKALKAKEAGSAVFVYMDVKGTEIALENTNIKFADFKPSQELITELVDKGVEVYVCPHCLMVNGHKMSEVHPGIDELTMDAMMKFSHGAGVTALDY